jgi:cytochrome c oxidase cbb3-type subunit I
LRVFRNPFYLMAGVYLMVDVLALAAMALVLAGVLAPIPNLVWLRIHLLTIGVVVQVILGTLSGYVAARLGAQPPGRALNITLWLLVNLSFALLLYSMPQGLSQEAAIGATGLFVAVVLQLVSLHRRGACPPFGSRASMALFIAGPMFFLIGIFMAVSMLLHWPAPGGFFGEIEGHVHANVWGFLAMVVAGFLLELIPAAVGRPLRWPHLVSITSWLLILGALGLVGGPWLGIMALTMAGIAIYVAGTALLITNLAATAIAAHRWTANIGHLLFAYIWMIVPAAIAPIILAITGRLPSGAVEAAAVSGLIAGWVLQIVFGALPMRLRTIRQRATGWDGCWVSVVLLNLGALLIWVAAFASSSDLRGSLTVAGYSLVTVASIPPLIAILRLLFAGPKRDAPEQPPTAISIPA